MTHLFKHAVTALVCGMAWTASVDGATLLENVHGYTLVGERLEQFTGLVFDGGKGLAAGAAPQLRRQFPAAIRVDGHGKTLLPGLIDAHGHVIDLGFDSVQIQLTGSTSLAEAQSRIRVYARANPGRTWLLGGGWNQVQWGLKRFPVARELDASVSDRPAVLDRIDGHAKWLNSKALAAAGITRATADPTGGRIERDAEGYPTGVLVDKAMELIEPFVPQPSDAERLAA